ncbi:unnamed protein product, partial [Heterotrigona itama]
MLSFLRKISIGGRIKDGVPTSDEMEAVEDCLDAKNRGLVSQSDTELKESLRNRLLPWLIKFKIIIDLLRTIKDPEKPQTLEQLDVVYEDCVEILRQTPKGVSVIRIEFNPTVPHCSLATLIGLCIRVKLERHLVALFKLDIFIKKGAHSTEQE